jgi:hypothetical protein
MGWMKWRYPFTPFREKGDFFLRSESFPDSTFSHNQALREEADSLLQGTHRFFFHKEIHVGKPHWKMNYLTPSFREISDQCHWSEAYSELQEGEDVKGLWELSRFYWMLTLTRAYLSFREDKYLQKINEWVKDWKVQQPPYRGIQWACAQETSYRVIHSLTSLSLLGSPPSPSLIEFMVAHLKRIRGTLAYGIAQKNNHGTTETAALLIGGAWLSKQDVSQEHKRLGQVCEKLGRKHFEKLLQELIQEDGSFSMYSTNYHRVVMQTCSFVLYHIQKWNLAALKAESWERIEKLLLFQESITDPLSGGVPNIGANDGSYMMKLNSEKFSNFKPSSALLRALLKNEKIKGDSPCEDIQWLLPESSLQAVDVKIEKQQNYPQFGLARVSQGRAQFFLKYPHYRFRPSQCDIGHFDFWLDGKNWIHDAGTYNYQAVVTEENLSLESHHNTLAVPSSPQLTKVSPFLYKDWPVQNRQQQKTKAESLYDLHYYHQRLLSWSDHSCLIKDTVRRAPTGFLNWNLHGRNWKKISENQFSNSFIRIGFNSAQRLKTSLEKSWTSSSYCQKELSTRLRVSLGSADAHVETLIEWDFN